jgi:hypothetical protein
VFHSLDKVTSLFLHLFPAFVAWTERWHPDVVRLLHCPPTPSCKPFAYVAYAQPADRQSPQLASGLSKTCMHARMPGTPRHSQAVLLRRRGT